MTVLLWAFRVEDGAAARIVEVTRRKLKETVVPGSGVGGLEIIPAGNELGATRVSTDKDKTCPCRADCALQNRDAGHGDTPLEEARNEQLRCLSPYSFTQSAECRAGSKTCSFVSSAAVDALMAAASVGFLGYGLKVRSKKSTNARALAVAARPVGSTGHRSRAGRFHSNRIARTAPDRSSG
jgi:hypothetical protein